MYTNCTIEPHWHLIHTLTDKQQYKCKTDRKPDKWNRMWWHNGKTLTLQVDDTTIKFLCRYRTDLDSFKEKVRESIESCRQEALNPDPSDPHGIKWVQIIHESLIFPASRANKFISMTMFVRQAFLLSGYPMLMLSNHYTLLSVWWFLFVLSIELVNGQWK